MFTRKTKQYMGVKASTAYGARLEEAFKQLVDAIETINEVGRDIVSEEQAATSRGGRAVWRQLKENLLSQGGSQNPYLFDFMGSRSESLMSNPGEIYSVVRGYMLDELLDKPIPPLAEE